MGVIDIRTGKTMTRGGFLKGILASGIAPSITMGVIASARQADAVSARGLPSGGGARRATNFWNKPYDAEVEYLLGDGKSYIILGKAVTYAEVQFRRDTYKQYGSPIGLQRVESPYCAMYVRQEPTNTYNYIQYGGAIGQRIISYGSYHTLIYAENAPLKIDGSNVLSVGSDGVTTEYDWWLFGANGGMPGSRFMCDKCQISYAKIGFASYSLDLIPVRVGSVGHMYDRISGKLFSNSGTGAFDVGRDV